MAVVSADRFPEPHGVGSHLLTLSTNSSERVAQSQLEAASKEGVPLLPSPSGGGEEVPLGRLPPSAPGHGPLAQMGQVLQKCPRH